MKLFTAEEIKNSKATELARDLKRTADIKETLDRVRTNLNNANRDFELALARHRVEWAKEEEERAKRIGDLEIEIKDLAKKREALLIPIEIDRKKVDNIISEANDLMSQALEKQKDADELSEKLQDRLDEVSEKEESLEQREKILFLREKGIETQTENTKRFVEDSNRRVAEWVANMESKDKENATKKKTLELKEIEISHREKDLKEKQKDLRLREIALKDQYETLLRTQKQLQKQNGK